MRKFLAIIFVLFLAGCGSESALKYDKNAIPLDITAVDMKYIKSKNLPVILDFGADDCEQCKKMRPALVEVNNLMQGKAVVHFIDIGKNPSLADNLPVKFIPTQIFINKDGSPFEPSEILGRSIKFQKIHAKKDKKHLYTIHEGELKKQDLLDILYQMGAKVE